MESNVRAVIIGGGVVGCSIAYHLTKKGWDGIVICEKAEVSSGATTHAAGHVILYTLDPTISRLNQYGVDLYPTLEAETGFSPGYHACGNLRLATHPDRLDEFHRYLGIAKATGVDARLIDAEEVGRLWPLMQTEGILGGVLNSKDGHISPADLAQSFAAGARQRGAKIHRQCEVTGLRPLASGGWEVQTTKGTITCDHVVSATGNYSQRTARMVGAQAQCVPVRHQYIITEPIPELTRRREAGLPEMPVVRDPEQSFYTRQEGDALAMGAYDGRGDAKFVDDVPPGHGSDPFPDELEKLLPYLESAMGRIPMLETVGIRRAVNYAMPYTPDDLPTTGPAFGLKNFWLAEGNPFGITLSAGIGWQLSEWIVEGEPSLDMWCCDSRRFGPWATRKWSARKVEEAYERTYLLPKPGEELPAGRSLRVTPLHDLLAARGAVFGAVAGWERANWFAPQGTLAEDVCSFFRPNWFEAVGAECRKAQTGAAIADTSHGAVFRVSGDDAAALLARALATVLPEVGTIGTGYALTRKGTFRSEFGLYRDAENSFLLTGAAAAERHDLDLLLKSKIPDEHVQIENLTVSEGSLLLFGATADTVLGAVCDASLSEVNFPAGTGQDITVNYAPVRALRTNPFGFPGWELHVSSEMLRHVFLALESATPIGARALEALRVERGTPAWAAELTREVTPAEAAMTGLSGGQSASPARRLVHLQIDAADHLPLGVEPIRDGSGRLVGATTSGSWGHLTGRALALGFIDGQAPHTGLEVLLMGTWRGCTVVDQREDGAARHEMEREAI